MIKVNLKKNVFPTTVLYFIKEIKKSLKEKCWNSDLKDPEYVAIYSKDIEYCYDAIRLVEKFFTTENWSCKMSHFLRDCNDFRRYTWTFKRKMV